jgi:KilA domain-containing protein
MKNRTINVNGSEIALYHKEQDDYISLTDIARYRDAERTDYIIQNWLRNRNTIEFLGTWEQLNNLDFKPIEFDGFKKQAGLNSFALTAKRWIEKTGAIGLVSKAGRYGGTYAHKDIAFEFAAWISVEFKLYLIKEFQRLKEEESRALSLEWNFQRTLAKVNYRIHTDGVKEKLIPPRLTKARINAIYANEADLLNVALFGVTAREWREANPAKEGNIRDYASLEQLVVLSNLESINSVLIHQGLPQADRLPQLNGIAITQMKSLTGTSAIKRLAGPVVKEV